MTTHKTLRNIHFYFKRFVDVLNILKHFILPNTWNLIFSNNKSLKNVCIPRRSEQKVKLSGKGKIKIGKSCTLGFKIGGFNHNGIIEIQARSLQSQIKISDNVAFNNNVFVCSYNKIEIGENCRIGQNVTIFDFDAHNKDPEKRSSIGEVGHVRLENNCWIGNNVVILKNSVIGENSVIGAGSIVSGQFPDNVIIGGVPAKIIGKV
jgi:maltose O-acetyltransferase